MFKRVLTYDSEIWTRRERDKKKILATEMDATIRSAEVPKTEHKTNVKQIMGTEKNSYR